MNKVSIIVPIYNSEKYLKRCIDSITNQSHRNMEIILVDDGSTDKSAFICDGYLEKDNRVKVIHQVNRGVSHSRNAGIASAVGSYIMFVDSDDKLSLNAVASLLRHMLENDTEISFGLVQTVGGDYPINNSYKSKGSKIFNNHTGVENFLLRKTYVYAFGRLYKKSVLENIRFEENISINEDRLFAYDAFSSAGSSIYVDEVVYYYYQNATSTTHSGFTERYFDIVLVNNMIFEKVKKSYPDLIGLAETDRLSSLMWLHKHMTISTGASKKYKKEYNSLRKRIISNNTTKLRKTSERLKWLTLKYIPLIDAPLTRMFALVRSTKTCNESVRLAKRIVRFMRVFTK